MNQFIYPVYCLSLKTDIKCKQLSYSIYKNLVKMLVNNDIPCLLYFLDNILSTHCIDCNIKSLTTLDKFYIIISMYGISLSTDVNFNLLCPKTKKSFNYKFDINNLLLKLQSLKIDSFVQFLSQGITYTFSLPRQFLNNNNLDEILRQCLYEIRYKSNEIFECNTTSKEIVDKLPLNVVKKFKKWYIEQKEKFEKMYIFEVKSPYSENSDIKISCSFSDDSLLTFIKNIYQDDLRQIYLTEYKLIQQLGFCYDDFNKITPAEIVIYSNIEAKQSATQAQSLPQKQEIVK